MSKKSKWFVVCTEGATTDGRTIARNWIEEMAESYDAKNTYGARINLDHIKLSFLWPDMPNSLCFGDVLAVKAQEREDGKLQLLAEIQPTDGLIELNKQGQKVYTSVEIDLDFAGTGKAYLVGLAVTDNPASLGTEMLAFSHNGLNSRKAKAENLFTAAIETHFEFIEEEEKQGIFEKIKALFVSTSEEAEEKTNKQFANHEKALELLAQQVAETQQKVEELTVQAAQDALDNAKIKITVTELQSKFAQIESEPAPQFANRPTVAGSNAPEDNGRIY